MYFCSLADEALTDPSRREGINLVLLECKHTNLQVPSKSLTLGKSTKLPKKSKIRTQRISNKDKSKPSLFYKYFFPCQKTKHCKNIQEISLGKKNPTKLWKITKYHLLWFNLQNCAVFSSETHHSSLSAITLIPSCYVNAIVNHSCLLLGSVCILASAPMCFCGSPSHCRCLFLLKFLSSISERKQKSELNRQAVTTAPTRHLTICSITSALFIIIKCHWAARLADGMNLCDNACGTSTPLAATHLPGCRDTGTRLAKWMLHRLLKWSAQRLWESNAEVIESQNGLGRKGP